MSGAPVQRRLLVVTLVVAVAVALATSIAFFGFARSLAADVAAAATGQDPLTLREIVRALLWRVGFALAIGLGVAVVASILAAGWLSRPLAAVAGRARRLGGGERGIPASPSGIAEIDQVDAALAALDAALAHSEARQREFLLSVSHEIRTPLTALRGYAEALADGVVAPEEVPEVGRTLQAEAARLTRFTDDLLALARLEADDFRLDLADVDVATVLREAADAWRAAAGGVVIDVDAVPAVARTDPHRLRQLVDGLVENALRVAPEGSRISLSARPAAGGAVVEVADGGPGIDPADLGRAFERGFLHERYRGSRPVGSGLGLSIAARLAERMGARVEVESGAGTRFRITLP